MTELDLIATLAKGGGYGVCAALALYLLWKLQPVLKSMSTEIRADIRAGDEKLHGELFEMRITQAAQLERDRIRDERRKRDSMQVPLRSQLSLRGPIPPTPTPSPPPRGALDDGETTDMKELIEIEREKAIGAPKRSPRSERAPRSGTHHDQ